MIDWYAKFEGRKKRVEDIASPELRAIIEPLHTFLAERFALFAEDRPESRLEVVFSWNSDGILSFVLTGESRFVAAAVSLVGEREEFRYLDS